LDPFKINRMSLEELETLFKRLPRHPRYVNDAPQTIKELTRIVVEDCGGDASRIWKGRTAIQVHQIFDSIHGVGPGIASMAVLLIEQAFPVRFEDRENMDIKPDVHTVRVLYRLGASHAMTTDAALEASRRMNPEFPGKVDGALWEIGRHWCHPTDPDCASCPVTSLCAKRLDGASLQQSVVSGPTSDVGAHQGNKKKIVLISCVSEKLTYRAKAKNLYISPLFTKNLSYAHSMHPDAIYVLSSKYGLIDLEKEIDPYNLTLNTLSAGEIKAWANHVLQQLSQVSDLQNDHFIFLAGMNYRKYLLPSIPSYEVPMEGLKIGKQLQFLSNRRGVTNTTPMPGVKISNSKGEGNPETVSKYSLLGNYFIALPVAQSEVTLTFSHIEQVLNDKLPSSALRYRAWWSNETEGSHSQARVWMNTGWLVDNVDFSRKQVRFIRRGK